MADSLIKVALIGNPNVGKTSVFNALTGLHQQVGNYPGITVDKKIGTCKINDTTRAEILDLPGTYSLNASSIDENLVTELLMNRNDEHFPDVVVLVAAVENLKRNLLLYTQIKDLEIPVVLVINRCDRMKLKGIELDIPLLEQHSKTKIATHFWQGAQRSADRGALGLAEDPAALLRVELHTAHARRLALRHARDGRGDRRRGAARAAGRTAVHALDAMRAIHKSDLGLCPFMRE